MEIFWAFSVFFNEVLLQWEADVTAQLLLYVAVAAVLCTERRALAPSEVPGLQPRMASSKLETGMVFPSPFFPSAMDKHLKNFGIKISILLEDKKSETGFFFFLPLQVYRLWVCVSQEVYEWRGPAGVFLQQDVFASCTVTSSLYVSLLHWWYFVETQDFCVPWRCRLSSSFQCGASKVMGNIISSKTNVHQIPRGLLQYSLQISENQKYCYSSVSEVKETIEFVHKSLLMSTWSCSTRILCLNGTWYR